MNKILQQKKRSSDRRLFGYRCVRIFSFVKMSKTRVQWHNRLGTNCTKFKRKLSDPSHVAFLVNKSRRQEVCSKVSIWSCLERREATHLERVSNSLPSEKNIEASKFRILLGTTQPYANFCHYFRAFQKTYTSARTK